MPLVAVNDMVAIGRANPWMCGRSVFRLCYASSIVFDCLAQSEKHNFIGVDQLKANNLEVRRLAVPELDFKTSPHNFERQKNKCPNPSP